MVGTWQTTSNPMIKFDSIAELTAALQRAADAHHEYEHGLGHTDTNWPEWYASHISMEQTFAAMQEKPFAKMTLAELKREREVWSGVGQHVAELKVKELEAEITRRETKTDRFDQASLYAICAGVSILAGAFNHGSLAVMFSAAVLGLVFSAAAAYTAKD